MMSDERALSGGRVKNVMTFRCTMGKRFSSLVGARTLMSQADTKMTRWRSIDLLDVVLQRSRHEINDLSDDVLQFVIVSFTVYGAEVRNRLADNTRAT